MVRTFFTHFRQQWMGALALFLVLTGGTAYALDGTDTVFSDDIVNGEVRSADIASANVQNSDLGGSAVTGGKIAPQAVQSSDVQNDTLTGTDIANPTRSVNLPLGSFVQTGEGLAIDFDSSNNDHAPDFAIVNGNLVIEYDDDSGLRDGFTTGVVGSTFSVPQDYASGGLFALRVSKDGDQGDDEVLVCFNSVNGGGNSGNELGETITTDENATYLYDVGSSYAAGDSVGVNCGAEAIDDIVQIHSIEFRYQATQ